MNCAMRTMMIIELLPAVCPEEMEDKSRVTSQTEAKRPRRYSACLASGLSLSRALTVETTCTASDIAKAGCILTIPPRPLHFEDEGEMRRIYSLIYDVFRYKSVLNQALTDTAFFVQFPQFQKQPNLVWLLCYDLYKRRFLPRDHTEEQSRLETFEEAGLLEMDMHLWNARVKIAAAMSRLRIKNNALRLSQLLPAHLRDDHILVREKNPVTAWVNTFRINTDDVIQLLEKSGLKALASKRQNLHVLNCTCDDLCPNFIKYHPTQLSVLAKSALVRGHYIILQDRAFCLGPAVMCQILRTLDLRGTVVQTHIVSPRTTAYLANVLSDNEKIDTLIAFGAGDRKEEYDEYLRQLGVTNTEVRAERFVDVPSESLILENVVAVLANPPSTYSGVTDPVDLVCSRGGDLSMLELMTESGDMRFDRANTMLEEQRQTLRLAMSRPQIQVVLYENHSIVPAENREMVNRMLNQMNNNAREKHLEELGKPLGVSNREGSETFGGAGSAGSGVLCAGGSAGGGRDEESLVASSSTVVSLQNIEVNDPHRPNISEKDIAVPPCDLFELRDLSDLSPDKHVCVRLEKDGCYLAYLRRKEIVRLNAKYMINIAESRGLFGECGASKETKKSQSGRQQRKKPELQQPTSGSPTLVRPKSRRVEIERIAAPTQASILRRVTNRGKRSSGNVHKAASCSSSCPRHQNHLQHEATSTVRLNPKVVAQLRRQDVKRWWAEAARHILTFGFSFDNGQNSSNELLKPPLKLTRTKPYSKIPLPVNVTLILFNDPQECPQ